MILSAPKMNSRDAWEKVRLARRPHRPHALDYIGMLCSEFVELRGDRGVGDDPAVIGGVGRTPLGTVVVLGHQKGRTIEENIQHHYGMPYPEGFHKITRLMRHAEKFGMPLVCLLDTPGCQVDQHAEALGQTSALGQTLMTMAHLRVPIISVVIGEAAAGAALALGIADSFLMLEHAIFSVASPEAIALLLWQDARLAPEAARIMKITAQDICELGIADEIVPEPVDGAHTDHETTLQTTVAAILRHLALLQARNLEHILWNRYAKHRALGQFYERNLEMAAPVYVSGTSQPAVAR